MLNPDYLYLVYDIVLDDEEKIRLDLYESRMENNGKERKYVHNFIKSVYPENLESEISRLKLGNYISKNSFGVNFWDVHTISPILNIKLMFLAKDHQLLEKAYDAHTIIEGMLYITRYIYYVNTKTGQEYVMNVGTEKFSKENILMLEAEGYKAIENSSLINRSILYPNENTHVNKR